MATTLAVMLRGWEGQTLRTSAAQRFQDIRIIVHRRQRGRMILRPSRNGNPPSASRYNGSASAERPCLLRIERQVDQRVVVEVDDVVVVEVAVGPAGARGAEAEVGARVVVEVDRAVQVRVAVERVAQQCVAVCDGERADRGGGD